MKIDLNCDFKDLSGKIVKVNNLDNMAKFIAEILGNASSPMQSIKYYSLATKLYNDSFIEIDESDFQLIYKTVQENKVLPAMWSAQILMRLDSEKMKQEKK
jgi:hypothetical protein